VVRESYRKKPGRPPAGPKGEKVSAYPQLTVRLPPETKAKLNTLTDAIKVIPIISEAQAGNLIGSTTPFAFSASSSGIISGVLGFPSVPGCASPFPANIIPANRLAAAPTGTWQPGVAGMNETATKASPSSHWFTKTILEPNPAPRQ